MENVKYNDNNGINHESIKEYYGKILQKSTDLKTNACCTAKRPPQYILDKMKNIHPNVSASYYGCGLIIPSCLQDTKVIDLGCGTGRDVYLLSQFIGNGGKGKIVGIDMTKEQLETARSYTQYHQDMCPAASNVEFRQGYIELLDELDLEENSFDLVISNCVINLCLDKERVLKQIYKVLSDGGEFYFSDIYASQRIPDKLRQDPVLYGECLSGALYWNDFLNLAKQCGFQDPRLVSSNPITINNEEIEQKIGHISFYSATYRLFKLKDLEPDCEDYGQAVIYKGTIKRNN